VVLAGAPDAPPVPEDLYAEPGLFGQRLGADVAAEDDRGAAVVIGKDGLQQGRGSGRTRDGRGQDRALAVGGG